jgi:hypothetical protein
LAQRGDDALVAFNAYLDLLDTLGEAHVHGQANSLGTVIDENSADRHADPSKMYIATVYRIAAVVN